MAIIFQKTPLNEARRALYEQQNRIRQHEANMKQQNPEGPQKQQMLDTRKEMAKEDERLQETLGHLILTAGSIYVAMDTSYRKPLPMIDMSRGFICIFSTKELGEKYVKDLRDKNYLYLTIAEIPGDQIKNALRSWEDLGVHTILLDDGEMPVLVAIRKILPHLEKGFIEAYNAGLRNMMTRNLQIAAALQRHDKELDPNWKGNMIRIINLNDPALLRAMGKTALFVPMLAPPKQRDVFRTDYICTRKAHQHLHALIAERGLTNPPISRASFTGKLAVIEPTGALPLRIAATGDNRNWIIAYTSRETAMESIAKQKDLFILAITMEELLTQVELITKALSCQEPARTIRGLLLDPEQFFYLLDRPHMEQAVTLKDSKPTK